MEVLSTFFGEVKSTSPVRWAKRKTSHRIGEENVLDDSEGFRYLQITASEPRSSLCCLSLTDDLFLVPRS